MIFNLNVTAFITGPTTVQVRFPHIGGRIVVCWAVLQPGPVSQQLL